MKRIFALASVCLMLFALAFAFGCQKAEQGSAKTDVSAKQESSGYSQEEGSGNGQEEGSGYGQEEGAENAESGGYDAVPEPESGGYGTTPSSGGYGQ